MRGASVSIVEESGAKRSDQFRLYPIGDIHIGNAACDEEVLARKVKLIRDDPLARWVGLGDYAEWINRRDPRFDPTSLAPWIDDLKMLADLGRHQVDRVIDFLKPIGAKCLGFIEGNHEAALEKHSEREAYWDLAHGILGPYMPEEEIRKRMLGSTGWVLWRLQRGRKGSTTTFKINLHHGFVGGRLAGAKALNMQRWLWSHAADLVIFGHSHVTMTQVEAVKVLNPRTGKVEKHHRCGMYGGTFMAGANYAEDKGYFPMPITQSHAVLMLAAENCDRIQMVCPG